MVQVMRRASALFCLLALLGAIPPAPAQHQGHGGTIASEDNSVTVPDAPQDVQLLVGSKAGAPPQNASEQGTNFDHIDITSLVFGDETDTEFKIHMHLRSLEQTSPPGVGFPSWTVSFLYGKVNWRISWGQCQGGSARDYTKGCLSYGNSAGNQGRSFRVISAEKKADMKAVVFTVPKSFLFNENRVPAQFGTELTGLSGTASHFFWSAFFVPGGDPTGGAMAIDRAPNSGTSEKAFRMIRGTNSHGHIALHAAIPIRVSNGEATTIVYKLELYNHHTEPLNVRLETMDLPEEWSVRAPALIRLEGGETKAFPVLLALPFTHDHGKTSTFSLHAEAMEDKGSWAHQELGVYWTEIPQPSGHHEGENGGTFFHSAKIPNDRTLDQMEDQFPTLQYWMNGIQTDPDPAATDLNVPSQFNEYFFCAFSGTPTNCQAPPVFVASWFFPLSPELLLGLDFDLAQKGLLDVEILPKVQASTATLEARLLLCDPGQTNRVCPLNQTSQGAAACPPLYSVLLAGGKSNTVLAGNAVSKIHIDMDVGAANDFIVYKQGINMGLCVQLKTDTPQNLFGSEPRPEFVTKNGRFHMPLIEYHDPVDQSFENVGTLGLVIKSSVEKKVNAGKTAVWDLDLLSNATGDLDVQLEVQGINREWARVAGPSQVTTHPNSVYPFMVGLKVPTDAADGERAELTVVAQSVRDEAVVSVTKIRAIVVSDEQFPDEAGKLQSTGKGEESPGPGLAVLFVALAGAAVMLRRRV